MQQHAEFSAPGRTDFIICTCAAISHISITCMNELPHWTVCEKPLTRASFSLIFIFSRGTGTSLSETIRLRFKVAIVQLNFYTCIHLVLLHCLFVRTTRTYTENFCWAGGFWKNWSFRTIVSLWNAFTQYINPLSLDTIHGCNPTYKYSM